MTRGGKQVLPRAWLDDVAASGDPQAWSAGDFRRVSPGCPYCSNWYVDESDGIAPIRPWDPRTILFVDT